MTTIVVTGIGAVSGFGHGAQRLWSGLVSGDPAFRPIERFEASGHRTGIAAEVPDLAEHPSTNRRLTLADRYAVVAAAEALAMAGIERLDAEAGVFFGSSTGGMWESECFYEQRLDARAGRARLSDLVSQQYDGPGSAVARAYGASGPVESVSSACTSGALAIGAALDALRAGECDIAVAGGSDSFCRLTHAGFNSLRSVDSTMARPFAGDRAGLTLGEGAGVLVLESLDRARARGAKPLALLRGFGSSCDAHHMTAPEPAGRGAAAAIEAALRDAGLGPDAVDFVNAHATATQLNDAAEWGGLVAVFGARAETIPVVCPKGAIGHLLGAAGAIEAVITIACLAAQTLPPLPAAPVDPALPADVVRGTARAGLELVTGLSTNLAFGGSNTALIFARSDQAGR